MLNDSKHFFYITCIIAIPLLTLFCGKEQHHNHGHNHEHHENSSAKDTHRHNDSDKHDDHNDPHNKYTHKQETKSHDHHETVNAGKDMAVTKADERAGIQLSNEAIKVLNIKTRPLIAYKITPATYSIPKESIIYYEDKIIVYVKRKRWYTPLKGRVIKISGKRIYTRLKNARPTDLIITSGAPLLRLAYLEAFGASGHGHAH